MDGSCYATRSKHRKNGRVYEYAYIRYETWDPAKRRGRPRNLIALGRCEGLEEGRIETLASFLREWVRKDSPLPFEALRERFEGLTPTFKILCSRDFGLRMLIEQAWTHLGYKDAVAEIAADHAKADAMERAIFAMVLVQLVTPQSKRGIARWSGAEVFFPEGAGIKLGDLYDAMDVLFAGYETVELRFAERLRELGEAPVEFAQDTTTVSCRVRYDDVERAAVEAARQKRGEARRAAVVNEPPLRLRGKAKNKRNDLPQIVVEAIMGDNRMIVHHATHAGNASDKKLVKPTLKAMQRLGYKKVQWAADAGFNSAANRGHLRAASFEFVLSEGVTRTKVVQEALRRPGRYSPHPSRPEISFKCVVAKPKEEACPERLYIVRRNTLEERFRLHTIDRHCEKVQAILARGGTKAEDLLHHSTFKKYVRRSARRRDLKGRPAGRVILDRKAISKMRQLAGKSVIAVDDPDTHPLVSDDLYRLTGQLELVFRELKSTLDLGPVHHRRADRIEAHVMLGVMAQNIATWLRQHCGETLEGLRATFANLRVQEVETRGGTYWERTELEPRQRAVVEKLGLEVPPKRFTVAAAN